MEKAKELERIKEEAASKHLEAEAALKSLRGKERRERGVERRERRVDRRRLPSELPPGRTRQRPKHAQRAPGESRE